MCKSCSPGGERECGARIKRNAEKWSRGKRRAESGKRGLFAIFKRNIFASPSPQLFSHREVETFLAVQIRNTYIIAAISIEA